MDTNIQPKPVKPRMRPPLPSGRCGEAWLCYSNDRVRVYNEDPETAYRCWLHLYAHKRQKKIIIHHVV